jgi:CysZ protein
VAQQRRGVVRDFVAGIGYLVRGIGWTLRNPGSLLLGLLPALIVLLLYAAALITLAVYAGDLARDATPFADHWSTAARDTMRLFTAVAIVGSVAFVAIIAFTGITLAVGGPFYEKLAERVELSAGGAPPPPAVPLWTQITRAIGDSILLGLAAAAFGIVFFALGFIPGIGQTVIPVLATCVSGYFLAAELTALTLERRGLGRRRRFHLLRRNRSLSVGFGAATVVVFLIPLGAVLVMPGAVAGATMLARERLLE